MSQKTYNKAQCLKLLKVDAKTFDRWLKKANITPEPDTYDTRQKLLTYEQIVLGRRAQATAASVTGK